MPFGIEDSSIEKTGVKPYILTGAFLQVARAIFSDPNGISETPLERYIWHPDPKISRILIESFNRWKTEDVQSRPAVLVRRGPWKIGKLGLGDKLQGGLEVSGFDDEQHQVACTGSHSIICLGTTGHEAELVGTEMYLAFLGFSKVIREQFCLGTFNVTDIGPVAKFEESHTHFIVPITLTYAFFMNWELLRQTPEWMRTSFNIEHV